MGVVLACLAFEGAGSACGRAAWRHSARTVATGKKPGRYFRLSPVGPTKPSRTRGLLELFEAITYL